MGRVLRGAREQQVVALLVDRLARGGLTYASDRLPSEAAAAWQSARKEGVRADWVRHWILGQGGASTAEGLALRARAMAAVRNVERRRMPLRLICSTTVRPDGTEAGGVRLTQGLRRRAGRGRTRPDGVVAPRARSPSFASLCLPT